ncbi:hypothetical protein P7C70_g1528, partial [Phenoliferia sp. Uapishka_3]
MLLACVHLPRPEKSVPSSSPKSARCAVSGTLQDKCLKCDKATEFLSLVPPDTQPPFCQSGSDGHMQNGFANAAYPLLKSPFNAQSLLASSTEAVRSADQNGSSNAVASTSQSTVVAGKKRVRPAEKETQSPTGDGDDEDSKARKRRLALSCLNCRHRIVLQKSNAHTFALNSDVRHIARRLAHLESLFQATNPGLMPRDPSSTGIHPSPSSNTFDSPISPHLLHNNGVDDSSLREDPDEVTRQSHSDTEDAAHQLEDVAFGARVPVLRAISAAVNTAASSTAGSVVGMGVRKTRFGSVMTLAGTSIIAEPLSFDQDGRPRSAVRLGMDLAISTSDLPAMRSGSMAQIFAVLPGREIAEFLLQKYFSEMDWDFQPIDAEAFYQEHERYREMLMDDREDLIDPLWVAVLCMVLALSLEGFWSRPGGAKDLGLFRGLSEKELQDLPSVWHDASLRALQLGEWGGTPRIRTIQTIILFGQYIQISSSSGQSGRFLGWAASAIRIAQRMGIHRLGTNPEIMPPDDPALPPGKNSHKREMGVRLFNMLVCIDSLLSDATHRSYLLHPSQYNTARPTNLNHSDFSRTEWRTINPFPQAVYTDASFEIAQCNIAAQVRRALDLLVNGTQPFSYNRVLEQDREYKQVFENLPDIFSERSPPLESVRLLYQRALLHEGLYARTIRLHRPFLSRGYNPGSQFRFSTEQCVKAARLVIASNFNVLKISTSLWWTYTSTLGSAIVLFMDLFHTIDTDITDPLMKEKKQVLVKASMIFNTQVTSPALRAVVEQGRRILAGLFVAEESRRTNHAAHTLVSGSGAPPGVESFAHVLQRVSQEVSAEDHGVPLHDAPPAAASQHLARPTAPLSETYGSNLIAAGASQDGSTFGYWSEGGLAAGQDFTSFFDTLASEDWTAAFGNGTGSDAGGDLALMGQLAATW